MNQHEKQVYDAITFRPQTGLDIAKKLEKQTGHRCNISFLYPTLRRLERQGFVRSYWEIQNIHTDEFNQERGGARRRYYVKVAGGTPLQEPELDATDFAFASP